VHFSFIFILYIIHYILLYVCENLHLSLRTHSNDTRTNLNHKIKNKPCPCFIIFHIKIILYTYLLSCLWLYYYYYLCGNSYLGCFTVELYPTGPQVGQCFFPSIFFPRNRLSGWLVTALWRRRIVSLSPVVFFLHSLIILFSLLFRLYAFDKPF